MYRVEVKKIQNTDKFRPAAVNFEKHGNYTTAPKGTTAFYDYWDQETERCLKGYTTEDGDHISGYFYFYLNYCQIVEVVIDPITNKADKVKGFPRFWDYDKAFFDVVDEAERLGKHLAVLKARRKGYSYKIASMLCRNFYLIPSSKSYAYAAENEFLTKDGILTKAWEYMDFVDEHTAWYKKRQKVDTKMHKRASAVIDREGVKVEIGYKSEVIGVTLKNDVNKVRGKMGKLIIYEEAGKFPHLKTAWQIARPSLEQGSSVHGLQIAFGTGGSMDSDFEGLKDIFYEPNAYNCLLIENIWDEGATEPCGFYVPDYYNFGEEYMDKDGNSNVKEAIKYGLIERDKIIKSSSDRTSVDRYIAEHSFTPMEASLQISTNIFPKAELIKHLSFIKTNKSVQSFKQVGKLVVDEYGILKWEQSARPKDLTKYRLDPSMDSSGEIVIWEHPVENPPHGLYIASCDSYDFDQSGSGSLGSVFIYKRFQKFESFYDILVAEYTGRPEKAEMFYENVKKLLMYYNARLLFENQNPGILTYFRNNKVDYLLADQPDIIDKIIKNSTVHRAKGIHMTKEISLFAEGLIRDWLITVRSDGKMNLHTILSEPFLEELIAYNDKGNFDRVSSFKILMLYKEDLFNIKVNEKRDSNRTTTLFEQGIFKDYDYTDIFMQQPTIN
jgi:hypothetical protein